MRVPGTVPTGLRRLDVRKVQGWVSESWIRIGHVAAFDEPRASKLDGELELSLTVPGYPLDDVPSDCTSTGSLVTVR